MLRETHEAFECAAPAAAVQVLSDLARTASGRQQPALECSSRWAQQRSDTFYLRQVSTSQSAFKHVTVMAQLDHVSTISLNLLAVQ